MDRDEADDFIHPLAAREELRAHVLYRLSADDWAASTTAGEQRPR
jgi:hypothetical protein